MDHEQDRDRVARPDSFQDREHSLRFVVQCDVPADLHRELVERWGVPWLELYGLTEVGIASVMPAEHAERMVGSGSIGLPCPEVSIRVVAQARGVEVTPRVVRDGDENRLTGSAGLPGDLNPYRESLNATVPVAGAILPAAGKYDVVFDSPGRVNAGKFTFRFWINDVTPPSVKLLGYSGGVLRLAVSDRGSGVDPGSVIAGIDGNTGNESGRSNGMIVK